MSSCELPQGGGPSAACRVTAKGSRIHRFCPAPSAGAPHAWEGVPIQDYKAAAAHHCGVLRSVLVGGSGEQTRFHLRYFEVTPGGFTTLEHHQHEHVVIVLRGAGKARLGDAEHDLALGDVLYVAPHEVHQLTNPTAEPFGFLCLVDAERDRPVVVPAV
jgi:quercetin dioxygenase-like cupin family protein